MRHRRYCFEAHIILFQCGLRWFLFDLYAVASYSLRAHPYRPIQKKQVARLYRKALKTLSSWTIDREIFIEEATNLRARFDAERGVSNAKAIRLLKVSGLTILVRQERNPLVVIDPRTCLDPIETCEEFLSVQLWASLSEAVPLHLRNFSLSGNAFSVPMKKVFLLFSH